MILPEDRYVPIEDLAGHLSLAVTTVRSWVRSGVIPQESYIKVGNTYRFSIPEVVAGLKKGKIEPDLVPAPDNVPFHQQDLFADFCEEDET